MAQYPASKHRFGAILPPRRSERAREPVNRAIEQESGNFSASGLYCFLSRSPTRTWTYTNFFQPTL